MKFAVSRTSAWGDENAPCEEAYRAPYVRVDERTTDNPKVLPGGSADWFGKGRNHRVENGHLMRDFEAEGWFVDLADYDALIAFIRKYGDVVISVWSYNHDLMEIEIYDDYRE